MPGKSKTKQNSTNNGPVTRSSKKKLSDDYDITTYTKLDGGEKKNPIQIVSKNKLKPDPRQYAELEKKFERIEAKRKEKEAQKEAFEAGKLEIDALPISPEIWSQRSLIFFVTHFNVFLYAMCFFIQVGTLPVSFHFVCEVF